MAVAKAVAIDQVMTPADDLASWRERIKEALGYVDQTMAMVQLALKKIVDIGSWLKVKKGELKHGDWYEWLELELPELPKSTAARWMKLAEFADKKGADLENANSVTQAYRLAGLLPELEAGAGESKSSGAASFITHLVQAHNQLNARLSKCPVEQWPAQDRAILKQRIAPWVELYEKL
jgi:hypothetical protein